MACFGVLAVALGCGKKSSGSAAASPPAPNPAPVASGGSSSDVFTQNCARCHSTEPNKRLKGPSMAGIGSKPGRTADWIIAHIKNPKSHNPRSGMPGFEGKISDPDLKDLADYLIALK